MGNWLESATKNCCNELGAVATLLQNMEETFITANDEYYNTAQKASNPKNYQGQGATAFVEAVNSDINKSKSAIEGLGHVSSATTTLQTAITNSSQYYDKKLAAIVNYSKNGVAVPQDIFDDWRDQLITKALNAVGTQQQLLDDILCHGDTCILNVWSSTVKSVETWAITQHATRAINLYLDGYVQGSGTYDTSSQQYKDEQRQLENTFASVFDDMASSVKSYLQDWANEIERDYPTFQKTLSDFNYISARDLFYYLDDNVDKTQNTDKPITITPYTTNNGTKGLLITIGGTDMSHMWDTSIFTALETGMGIDNPYQADVEKAIQAYMQEHPEMAGADVTFAGYSLGGMVAQNVTDDSSFLGKYGLHVTNVVTYGSPVMGPPAHGVQYAMYDATYDPVPLLSHYENPAIDAKTIAAGLYISGRVPGGPLLDLGGTYLSLEAAQEKPWQQKLDTYIDSRHEYTGHIFNITDVGNQPAQFGPVQYLNFDAHQHYTISSQLNAAATALPNINPESLGPTEYFSLPKPPPQQPPPSNPDPIPAPELPYPYNNA